MKPSPCVAIIVLNWNGREDTLDCLASLSRLDYPTYQMIVVDNHSSDSSVSAIRAAYPCVTLIETEDNLGYAGGNNVGIRHTLETGADYILLLNNDTIVHPQMLDKLIHAAEGDPTVGAVAPKIYYYDEPKRIWCAGASIDWRTGITYRLRAEEMDDGQSEVETPVEFVSGCAMCVRRDVFEQVGLLDERYHLYYEETDWCTRATRQGYRILYVPQAVIWHKVSRTQRESPVVTYYMTRNGLLFLHDHLPWPQRGIAMGRMIIRILRTVMAFTLKPQHRDKQLRRNACIRGLFDFARGRLGALVQNERMR